MKKIRGENLKDIRANKRRDEKISEHDRTEEETRAEVMRGEEKIQEKKKGNKRR